MWLRTEEQAWTLEYSEKEAGKLSSVDAELTKAGTNNCPFLPSDTLSPYVPEMDLTV